MFTFFSKSHDWLKFSERFVCLGAVKKCVNGHGSVDGISSLAVPDGWQRLTALYSAKENAFFNIRNDLSAKDTVLENFSLHLIELAYKSPMRATSP